ncbi:HNH endonuclease [Kovacikia minuta CCNUW1]|uniref:HNH endonuclease n=1 Tax=Kovacikia minuta TaxID=2931930 RepID=UPI001CCC6128|nr:HNH endonuclease [Kovacikia minuta]UBF26208.1 HNH endonuclease [Kovacikia minuta CCNUW1]
MSISPHRKGVVVRSVVPEKSNYLDYRPYLRFDFWYSCAYCTITEVEAQGIGFQLDHYLPHTKAPELKSTYSNLMYSCQICNRNKSDYFPNPTQQQRGYVIIRPDESNPKDHFELEGYEIRAKTETGKFNQEKLELNRQTLCRLRETRERLYRSTDYTAFGVTELLSINIDNLPKDYRATVAAARRQFESNYQELTTDVEEYVRALAKSDLLDEEPVNPLRNKERKKYLDSINAIDPDYKAPKSRPKSMLPKTKRKGKKR